MSQLALIDAPPGGKSLACRLTPGGRIEVWLVPAEEAVPLSASVCRRIEAAFDKGRAHGVLHLGVVELGTELPPILGFWREVAKAFLARVCGALDPLDPSMLLVPEPDGAELMALAESVPPSQGAEFMTPVLLGELWSDLGSTLGSEAKRHEGGLQGFLKKHGEAWNVVGRVCLHLAENKRDPEHPFAFLATYVDKVSKQAKPQHLPLGRALQEYAGARNRQKLVTLLAPLARAAESSSFIGELFQSAQLYQPLAWTPQEAHRFLSDVEIYERAGLVVRTPAWWQVTKRPRPRVSVSVGTKAPSGLGMSALLDFDLSVTLGGEKLSRKELEELLAGNTGLVLLKGTWVEVDRVKLSQTLELWQAAKKQAEGAGVSFAEAMRMLSGARFGATADDGVEEPAPDWSEVVAGKWLASKLEGIRAPKVRKEIDANAGLTAELRPYQKQGVAWLSALRMLGLGACLADDMGLGKTIQVLGALNLARGKKPSGVDLLVVPASLVDNWRLEMVRFAPHLKVLIAHPSRIPSAELKKLSKRRVASHDALITTYGTAMRTDWIKSYPWRHLILDEAQAIKNPGAKQTRAIKALKAEWRLALTGTPVENRLGDLWSIFDFLNPGLLGSANDFTKSCKAMAAREHGYAPLRKLVQPYILRRLKTDKKVIADLPDKTEVTVYCGLSKPQAALYQESVREMEKALEELKGIQRRGLVLSFLTRLKQICNHPSQWLGDGEYAAESSGKLARLQELCEPMVARQDKVLVFTQFREMTKPLMTFLGTVFGRTGLVLHGGTAVKQRQGLVKRFQEDEHIPFMELSLKAGGTGLNLTAASHVIHFDRWWNPAVENQATDRAFRIGQKKNVLVHKLVCRGTLEERIHELIAEKQKLADEVLSSGAEVALTEMSNSELMSMVALDLNSALASD